MLGIISMMMKMMTARTLKDAASPLLPQTMRLRRWWPMLDRRKRQRVKKKETMITTRVCRSTVSLSWTRSRSSSKRHMRPLTSRTTISSKCSWRSRNSRGLLKNRSNSRWSKSNKWSINSNYCSNRCISNNKWWCNIKIRWTTKCISRSRSRNISTCKGHLSKMRRCRCDDSFKD